MSCTGEFRAPAMTSSANLPNFCVKNIVSRWCTCVQGTRGVHHLLPWVGKKGVKGLKGASDGELYILHACRLVEGWTCTDSGNAGVSRWRGPLGAVFLVCPASSLFLSSICFPPNSCTTAARTASHGLACGTHSLLHWFVLAWKKIHLLANCILFLRSRCARWRCYLALLFCRGHVVQRCEELLARPGSWRMVVMLLGWSIPLDVLVPSFLP